MRSRRLVRVISMITLTFGALGVMGAQAQEKIVVKFWSHDYPARIPIDNALIEQFEADNLSTIG